ncbi:uncharacterized protein UV8b_00190 [Ustilaginoidea virens]|uniref:Beta-fructofuranosidase n=1 Tax=Ustilaginoidea virens TaxID=1159556 RepID=A0A8E5HIA6_USTVR|nr:uncharacterized protein UV8b_00190 [Ustilaginoidea virens]QUC15949.1 hypothetical protein UV8b_00190 [Ustilaginoidea virens]
MRYRAVITLSCSLLSGVRSQSQNGPTNAPQVEPDVPSKAPLVGDYRGQYRPQVHFSAPKHFLNDPNGLFRDGNGTWHMYYQHNPTGNTATNQHWGHATSQDLYHWTNQPLALFPPRKNVYIYSGSAVVDTNNTSGFFPNQENGVVAIYTLAEYDADGNPGPQTQAIAYSRDGGFHFTPYANNPVIHSTSSQFRDPKVIRYHLHWVMVVAYSEELTIGIYTSPDLITWSHASNFTLPGLLGFQWECPNLVRMTYRDERGHRQHDMWTLLISINPGAPLGGSITEYYPGRFNGTHFEAVDSVARIADLGKDNYAGQFFYGTPDDEDPVFIAWASNWEYAESAPSDVENWLGAMTLPRRTYLTKTERVGWKWVNYPYNMRPIMGETLAAHERHANGNVTVDFSHVTSNAVYWEANVTGIPKQGISKLAALKFKFVSPVTAEYIRGGYYLGGLSQFYLDRGGAKGFDNVFFTDKFSASSLGQNGSWSMSGVLDRSMLEVFLEGGIDSGTVTFFPTWPLTLMVLDMCDLPKGVHVSIRVNALKSSWAGMESRDGLVYGNQSTKNMASEDINHLLRWV